MLTEFSTLCPHCGEIFDSVADCSAGGREYVEDCAICCCPVVVRIAVDVHFNLADVDLRRENE